MLRDTQPSIWVRIARTLSISKYYQRLPSSTAPTQEDNMRVLSCTCPKPHPQSPATPVRISSRPDMYTQHSAARIFQLPVEIRNKIWEECIGNVRFHMHWPPSEKDRLVADICREPECLICISNNLRNIHRYNEAETYPEDTKPVDMKSKSWIMPLLLTSRAM